MSVRKILLTASAAVIASSTIGLAVPANAASTWTNCTAVHKKYPHGVGMRSAHDKTTSRPVTNFKRSDSLYKTAMSHNKGLDRDKDKIACEAA